MKNQTNCAYAKLANLNNLNDKETLDFIFKGITKAAKAVKDSNESLLGRVQQNREDEKAIQALILKNLAMVADIAVDLSTSAADFFDLFQDGIEGLRNAIKGYNPASGWEFSTYAYPIVKREMLERKQEYGDFCRMPQGTVADIRKMERYIDQWQAEYQTGMMPPFEEIAEATGMTESRVRELQTLRAKRADLDAPVFCDDDSDLTFGGSIAGGDAADQYLTKREIRDIVEGVLSGLPENDAKIFRSLHGEFFDLECKDAKTIGEEIGRTAALVRMIRRRVLDALAASPAMQSYRMVEAA